MKGKPSSILPLAWMPVAMLLAASALYLTSRALRVHDVRVRRLRRLVGRNQTAHPSGAVEPGVVDPRHARALHVLELADIERLRILVFEPLE